jgi:hypothetical protein
MYELAEVVDDPDVGTGAAEAGGQRSRGGVVTGTVTRGEQENAHNAGERSS